MGKVPGKKTPLKKSLGEQKKQYDPKAHYDKIFTTIVYFHPYFTYHIKSTHYYNTGIHHTEINYPPFSIPRYTLDYNASSIYPKDIDEASVQRGFCYFIQKHSLQEISDFLNYQYDSYANKAGKNEDPNAYLDYLISTIEIFKEWQVSDYYKLKVVGKWIRTHKGYKADFNIRLINWIKLNRHFEELYNKERKESDPLRAFSLPEVNLVPSKEQREQELERAKRLALTRLQFLAGYRTVGRRITQPKDFERMVEYTLKMIEMEALPENLQPITYVDVSMAHIRYTYYLIHRDLYGARPKRDYFIDFLYKVFPSLFDPEKLQKSTVKTKFSQMPNSYKGDVEKWGKIGK